MTRAIPFFLVMNIVLGQSATVLSFEVASIKPSDPDYRGKLLSFPGGRFITKSLPVKELIKYAYGVHSKQILGGPRWLESDGYDINAKPGGDGRATQDQLKIMVQTLLADRFKLTFHRETKELSIYVLTVAKNGPKLKESVIDPGGPPGPSLLFRGPRLPGRKVTMEQFAFVMQEVVLDRPVVDKTGLPGKFDFDLTWMPDQGQFDGQGGRPPWVGDRNAPDLFEAIQEQLGLKLESKKAQVDILIIDHLDRPDEN